MATVHTITNAITNIASKVNAHQLLIDDLKKNGPPLSGGTTTIMSAPSSVDYQEIQGMIDISVSTLKDDVVSRQSREKAMLETSINHSVAQKIASAIADVDQKASIGILEERVKRIENRIEELVSTIANIQIGSATVTTPEVTSQESTIKESTSPEANTPEPEEVTNQGNPDHVPTPPAPSSKSRSSRRRGKASADDSAPGTLTLE